MGYIPINFIIIIKLVSTLTIILKVVWCTVPLSNTFDACIIRDN